MKSFAETLSDHPRLVAILGAVSGWASVDFLRAAQIAAAVLASLVSLCALILTGPQAVAKVRDYLRRFFRKRPTLD